MIRWSKKVIEVIRPWGPKAGAWCFDRQAGEWTRFIPRIDFSDSMKIPPSRPSLAGEKGQLLLPFGDSRRDWQRRKSEKYASFFAQVPEEARHMAARFQTRFGEQWQILQFINRAGRPAFELVRDCPALGFAVARNFCYRPNTHPARTARRLVGMKRRQTCAWLGFPVKEQSVKILGKIPPECVSMMGLKFFRDALQHEEIADILSHCRRVHVGVMRLASPRLFCHFLPRLILEVASSRREQTIAHSAYMLISLLDLADEHRRNRMIFRDRDQLDAAYQEIWAVGEYSEMIDLDSVIIPPPPLLGTPGIEPLHSLDLLIEEGRVQHNCLGSAWQIRQVAKGHVYYYRGVPPACPERCTFVIERESGKWVLTEIKGICNRPVGVATRAFVTGWLKYMQFPATEEDEAMIEKEKSGYFKEVPF